MNNILLVNWGTKDKQYVFRALEHKKLNVYLATSKQYPSWVLDYVSRDKLIYTNTYESNKLLADVADYIKKNKVRFDYIVTFFEMNMAQTAVLADFLNLNFIKPNLVARTSANKFLMRNFCYKQKILQPNYALFRNQQEGVSLLKSLSKNFTQPLVIKPIISGHSYGVLKISGKNKPDFLANFKRNFEFARQQLDSNFDEWMKYSRCKNYFLMEEYIPGKMISVDGLIVNHKIYFASVTDFKISPPPLLLQYETYIPSHLDEKKQQLIKNIVFKIISKLGVNNTGFHCELKLYQNKVYLIEFAARLPGGQMLKAYKKAFNIDLADLYLDILMGKHLAQREYKLKRHILQESIPLSQEGVLKSISGLKEYQRRKDVVLFSSAHVGQIVKEQGKIFEPLLYYQIEADNVVKLKQLQEQIKNDVKAEIVKDKRFYLYAFRGQIFKMTPKFLKKVLFNRGWLDKIIRVFE